MSLLSLSNITHFLQQGILESSTIAARLRNIDICYDCFQPLVCILRTEAITPMRQKIIPTGKMMNSKRSGTIPRYGRIVHTGTATVRVNKIIKSSFLVFK